MKSPLSRLLATIALTTLPLLAQGKTLLGVYHGNQGWDMPAVADMERWQGKQHAVLTLFTGWSEKSTELLYDHQLPKIWTHGNVPLITWEPHFGDSTPADIEARIAAGEHDALINTWAGRLRDFLAGDDGVLNSADDRRAYLRLGHEMNGNWYPWSANTAGETPADYVAMWRHIHTLIAATGITGDQLQWVWCAGAGDHGNWTAEQYYPGDDVVDWLALDGYNWDDSQSWSSTRSPTEIFDAMLTRLRAMSDLPVGIIETAGGTERTDGMAGKSAWIEALFDYVQANDIRMISWFNADKETDWAVYGGQHGDELHEGETLAYASYRQRVENDAFIAADSSNPRLMDNATFRGQFDTVTPAPKPAPTLPEEVTLDLIAAWDGGYCANVSISTEAHAGDWLLSLDANGKLLQRWGAKIRKSDGQFQFSSKRHNRNLLAGSATRFGYCAKGTLPQGGELQYSTLQPVQQASFGELQVSSALRSIWGGGYCMGLVLENSSAAQIRWSELLISVPGSRITSHWGYRQRKLENPQIQLRPRRYNRNINAASSRQLGYCAKGSPVISFDSATLAD